MRNITPTLGTEPKQFEPDRDARPRYDIKDVKAAASGHWATILNRVAGIPDDYLTSRHRDCPRCGGDDRWRCFDDFEQTGGALCGQCGSGDGKMADGFAVVMWANDVGFPQALQLVGDFLGVEPSKATPKTKPSKPKPKPEDGDEIHKILTKCSERLPLRDDHRDDLVRRGFTSETIERLGCWSLGTAHETVTLSVINNEHRGFDRRVPGFRGLSPSSREGMVIPVRDRRGRIVGNQVRHFAAGADKYTWLTGHVSPGSPAHHTPGCNADHIEELRVTEGPLKSELSYQLTGIPAASVQGVSNRERLFSAIKEIKPTKVLVAFDVDASGNKDVANAARETVALCRENNIEAVIETWDAAHKGIDDALTAGAEIVRVTGDAIDDHLASLAGEAAKPIEIRIEADDPEFLAKRNLEAYRATGRDICHWRGEWFTWKGKCWQSQSESYIRSRVRSFVESEFTSHCQEATERWQKRLDDGKFDSDEAAAKARPKKIKTTASIVRNAVDAMQSMVVIPDHVDMGCMLSDRKPRNLWPVQNGLVDLDGLDGSVTEPTKLIQPHTSDWFSDYSHDYEFQSKWASIAVWKQFLDDVFRDEQTGAVDEESIEVLQRWFGYCILPTTSLQKMLLLIGPSRSGKGVITRILKRIIGERFTSSPMLKSFGGDFGLQPLMNKRLAIVGDLKLDRYKHDSEAALETLLNVVGEDSIDVNIKGSKAATSTTLPVKFMLVGNQLPAFRDPAMALINRVVLIQFRKSFVGKEDSELTKKLMSEIDGIFIWALNGCEKLLADYRLPQPESGKETIEKFRKLVSPIRGFVFDCCELPGDDESSEQLHADRDDVFSMWRIYCEKIGREHPGTRSSFVRQLTESFPMIQESRLGSGRDGDRRWWALLNIRLSPDSRFEVTQNRTQNQDAGSDGGAR